MATKSRTKSKKNTNNSRVKKNKIKRRKLKIGAILVFLLIVICIAIIIMGILSRPITNIYISNNKYLSDQDVIELAGLSNYPSAAETVSLLVEKKLEKNDLIKSAKVYKKWFSRVYINIEENRPLFYNDSSQKTVLLDGKEIDSIIECATLINYVPDTIYNNFVNAMKEINEEILIRTSEIKYDSNDVDEERFLFIMNDGNYVYLTLNKFKSINNYISIIKKFGDKKGILYLDAGEYFQIFNN